MADFAALRRTMVDTQVRPADVTDRDLIQAMLDTPREVFLPRASAGLAYLDLDLPVGGSGRRLLQPMVLAKMVQALRLTPDDKVLDVGCATGYTAAVLSQLAGSVVALEEEGDLCNAARTTLAETRNVEVVQGRLIEGHAAGAPYNAILVEGAIAIEPEALCRQLVDGGRLMCIFGTGPAAKATLYQRDGNDMTRQSIFDASAPQLPGFSKPAAFVF